MTRAEAVALEVAGLGKTYGDVVAVDDVSFSIPVGGSMALVGESGSGKTTIAKMIMGLERVGAGTVHACGRDRTNPARSLEERRRRAREVQIVFQDPYSSLDPHQTIADMLSAVVRLHHRSLSAADCRDRVAQLLDMVGLHERHGQALPRGMSGGQRQRAAIARALAAEPQIVILDESVAALDVSIQAQVLNLLADLRDRLNVTYLLISHDLAVVRQLTDTAVVMRQGVVVESGSTGQILDSPQHPYTQHLRASVPGPGWVPPRRA
ncbi:ABC-type glutathione transport system ATPase component [Nocardioides sp. BE266]|jgi:ABC-type glutathione transport system ATPase component|uniref:ABC transporter ATP-binding protein n=1 Tax=Nocardioides sp. BE266 TaxID=2817725 RepID=UPI00285BA818|nr:ATP-binding cassette domain-containing protein [Nocardioides sp. BE266]MDR7252740.1 ABC-type glutathione transport system ATPase component [Nocardioides sp. BE266]